MGYLRIDRLKEAALHSEPYEYVMVDEFLDAATVKSVNETFPSISSGGSYPVEDLPSTCTMRDIIRELDSDAFQNAIAEKFNLDLENHPKIYSLRGHTRDKDGRIHTDSTDKLITVLLYLNADWPHADGRLRILKNGTDLEAYAAEVPPDRGTLLVFRRSDRSWHGHTKYVGQRRALQMNWIQSDKNRQLHMMRRRVSSFLKGALGR